MDEVRTPFVARTTTMHVMTLQELKVLFLHGLKICQYTLKRADFNVDN